MVELPKVVKWEIERFPGYKDPDNTLYRTLTFELDNGMIGYASLLPGGDGKYWIDHNQDCTGLSHKDGYDGQITWLGEEVIQQELKWKPFRK